MKTNKTMSPALMLFTSIFPVVLIILCSYLTARGDAGQYTFNVEVSGQGKQAMILIPGFASSGKVWDDTKATFEKSYKCYTLTMAGFAGVKSQEGATFRKWETSIATFIKDQKIEKPVVVGHSMGGVMALALAADYPALIGKIVVVDALPCLSALNNPSFTALQTPDCAGMIQQMTSVSDQNFRQMQERSVRGLVADTSKYNVIVGWSMQSDRRTMGEMFCDFLNTDMREDLKNIKCPALILLQPYFKNIHAAIDGQYRNLSTANLQYANNGLHFIMYDDQQWYLQQLTGFIGSK